MKFSFQLDDAQAERLIDILNDKERYLIKTSQDVNMIKSRTKVFKDLAKYVQDIKNIILNGQET